MRRYTGTRAIIALSYTLFCTNNNGFALNLSLTKKTYYFIIHEMKSKIPLSTNSFQFSNYSTILIRCFRNKQTFSKCNERSYHYILGIFFKSRMCGGVYPYKAESYPIQYLSLKTRRNPS